MMKVLYSKFNRNRLPQFQIKTSVIEQEGYLYVEKHALKKEAKFHLENIYSKYLLLTEKYPDIRLVNTTKLNNSSLQFEYINGNTLDALLLECVLSKNILEFNKCLKEYILILHEFPKEKISKFEPDSEFIKIFGCQPEFEDVECMLLTNVDLTFDNIMIYQSQKIIIDYEWIFTTKVPVSYLLYRSLNRFFWKYGEYLRGFLYIEDFYKQLGITYIKEYEEMEKGFQSYVLGDRQHEISRNYQRQSYRLDDLKHQTEEYRNKLTLLEGSLDDKCRIIEELGKLKNTLEENLNQLNDKLRHAQFSYKDLKNQLSALQEKSRVDQINANSSKEELKVLRQTVDSILEIATKEIELIDKTKQTWRGRIGRKIIGKKNYNISKRLLSVSKVNLEQADIQIAGIKNRKVQDLQYQIDNLLSLVEEQNNHNKSKELELNHLQSQLTDILNKHHNIVLEREHLAYENHQSNVKNKELNDAYLDLQGKYHELKYQNNQLMEQLYKGLGEEERID